MWKGWVALDSKSVAPLLWRRAPPVCRLEWLQCRAGPATGLSARDPALAFQLRIGLSNNWVRALVMIGVVLWVSMESRGRRRKYFG